ncbi:2-amino-4-hydroxy-6-hydroxymethyldihydropteridinediphosphokinase [Thermosyntropha lipolytica DSM 11003]|uniref:2-amino-4-hydroxy-6-hydroxymethyldihydropteridine diphosphokinase n=1 Tax=Thermosyntropha lipolytica DSM 11003 TaxID=1123382 RepID=A0A1M5JV29_9FIRM|nr:2-amino-4-hydroxy-6-hydroxymethyldihydropteridine diphosphokinase [Thermosyntropha lipolytica]SHG44119.1 2-amino-4-hydroxy-6-hydroxymethyldihydropteridinediphosphokinase [Thermosyntropha lipolytica DSM 11003]
MKKRVLLGIGSNLGDKKANLETAIREIGDIKGVEITGISSFYITPPWGREDQDEFLNGVVEIETDMPPLELLHRLQAVEINMGRERKEKWGPRNIDIDILLYGEEVMDLEELKVPHPYMRERLFVLVPLAEIRPDLVFPDDGAHIGEVLAKALRNGKENIRKLDNSPASAH